jgi:hypothetical protein
VPESHPSWSLGANRGLVREVVPEERTVALAVIRGAMWCRDDEPEDWPRYPAMGDPPPVAPGGRPSPGRTSAAPCSRAWA